jgi:hypothetical protein
MAGHCQLQNRSCTAAKCQLRSCDWVPSSGIRVRRRMFDLVVSVRWRMNSRAAAHHACAVRVPERTRFPGFGALVFWQWLI